jgi:hypothetical protein
MIDSKSHSRIISLSRDPHVQYIIAAVLAALIGLLLANNALQRFDFFDMSSFLDAGYRVSLGQRPYRDFFYIAGPVHLYMHAFFISLFGFTRWAVQAHLFTVTFFFGLAMFWAAKDLAPFPLNLLLAGIGSLAFYGPISFPWYDQNAWFWVLIPFCFLVRYVPFKSEKVAIIVGALNGAGLALAVLTKANVGLFAAIPVGLTLLASPHRKQSLLACASVGTLVTCGILLLVGPKEFVEQTIVAYHPGERLVRFDHLRHLMGSHTHARIFEVGIIAAILGGWPLSSRQISVRTMFFGLTLAGLLSTWTGSMVSRANWPSAGMELILLTAMGVERPAWKSWTGRQACRVRWVVIGVAILYVSKNSFVMTRQLTVWDWRPGNKMNTYVIRNRAFQGWRCNPDYGRDLDAAVDIINRKVPQTDSLFIFPTMMMIYGITHHESYLGAPFIFQINLIPPPGAYVEDFRRRFYSAPPRWILMHEAFERQWAVGLGETMDYLGLTDFIHDRYEEVWKQGHMVLLRLKPGAEIG